MATAVGYDVVVGLSFWYYLLLFFCYSLILFWGSYFVYSNFFIDVVCAAQTNKKVIALSFDDGPATYTSDILRLLKEKKVEATFFCIGHRAIENQALIKQIHEEGHIVGNHSYSHHFWFDLFSTKQMKDDLEKMNWAVNQSIGLRPRLFRPPYGVTNPNLAKAIKSSGFVPIGWNVRSLDTAIKDEQKLLSRVCKALRPGAIVLFHDTSQTTLAILPAFINYVSDNGYTIVRLDKMLNINAYQ